MLQELWHPRFRLLYISIWLSSAPLIFSSLITWFLLTHQDFFFAFDNWHWGVFFFITSITMAVAITPTTFIAIVTGFFLGLNAIWGIVVAYQIASVIGYLIGQNLLERSAEVVKKKYPVASEIMENARKRRSSTVLLARLSPTLPFALMNVVLSIAKIPIGLFLCVGLIGMLPRTVFFIWVGSEVHELQLALEYRTDLWIAIPLSLIVFLGFYFILRPQTSKND